MSSVCDAKLIGSAWNDGFVDNEVYVKSGTTVADKIEIVMSHRILHHLVRSMQIDVLQSKCVHSQ